MKKIVGIFATVLLIVTLAGCGNKANSAQSDKQDSARQSSVKKAESKKKIAKLRSENESLKKKESESVASSSKKASSESAVAASSSQAAAEAASSSAQAASESMAAASSAAESSSIAAENTTASTITTRSGSDAGDLRSLLVENFGCSIVELNKIQGNELVNIFNDVESQSGDIGGFYSQVKARYPNIGGNLAGPDTSSDDDEVNLDGF